MSGSDWETMWLHVNTQFFLGRRLLPEALGMNRYGLRWHVIQLHNQLDRERSDGKTPTG